MKILMVHGRNQAGLDPNILKSDWLAGLARGCEAAGLAMPDLSEVVAFPFYGDRLATLIANLNAPPEPEVIERGDADPNDPYLEFRSAVVEDLRVAAGITDAEVQAQLPDAVRERGLLNWERVQAILRVIDARFPWVGDRLIERVTRDVWIYLTYPGVRDTVDALVAAELTDQPTIVIGHSLGSVITYSVLRRHNRCDVPRYITLGSPLGVYTIRRRFLPLCFPPGVRDWFNAYDPHDVVALRGLDPTNFPVDPEIRNNGTLVNRSDDRHGIVEYLADPSVAREIADAFHPAK